MPKRRTSPTSFSVEDVSGLSDQWRYALVARLIRSIAMAYGVSTDYAGGQMQREVGD
jgi:hypothetical protein